MNIKRKPNDEGKRFKQIRINEGLTQKEFGDRLGKQQSTIQKYEAGVLRVPTEVIAALHNEFKIAFDWYHNGIGETRITGEKSNLITDLGTLKTTLQMANQRIEKLENQVTILIKEVYVLKNGRG
jgi:transcriptional regulator with XRE-family HTH domain